MRRLSPLQRSYLIGYRRGLNRAWATMRDRAQGWEDQIAALQGDYEMLVGELRCARDEQAIKQALDERVMYPDALLN